MGNGDDGGNRHDTGGSIARAHGVAHSGDLADELRRTRELLQATRADYADMYERSPVGHLTLDGVGAVRSANPRAAELLGVSVRALAGAPLSDILVPEDRGELSARREQAHRANADTWTCEVRIGTASGEHRWVRLESMLGAVTSDGPLWRTVVLDIHGRREAEAALRARESDHRAQFEGGRPPTPLSSSAAHAVESVPSPILARGRVLVVDDEPLIRATIIRILRREHDVIPAGSGAEAQALLESDQRFDMVLCDLMMPEMTGMELYAWVAALSESLASRMIFMTGGAFTPDGAEFIERSTNPVIDKPLDVTALRRAVREMVDQRREAQIADSK